MARRSAAAVALLAALAAPVSAQHRLCDPGEEDCRDLLIARIRAENVRLDVAFWFIQDTWMADEIVKRWQAGVPVRILMDTEANLTTPGNAALLDKFKTAGIPMRERVASGILHWKMMIFAGQGVVEFSGANYSSDAWVPSGPAYTNYVDEVITFTSQPSIVQSFMTKYDDIWTNTQSYQNYGNITTLTRAYPTYPIDPALNFVPTEGYFWRSAPEYRREPSAIDVIMYRITDSRFTDEMLAAKQRGVTIRLITEPQQYRDVRRLWHSWNVDRLYMAGVPIKHRVHAGLNHQKSVLLRGLQTAIFGSSNWSNASAEYQEEHNLFTQDAFIYQWLVNQFERKWNNTTGITENDWFTPLPPDQPTSPTPAPDATNLSATNVTLRWYGGPWAHRYDVYLGTQASDLQLVGSNLPLGPSQSDTEFQSFNVGTLKAGTRYYWRIVGKTIAEMTATSPTWSFTTAGTPPPSPTLVRHPYLQQITPASAVVVWATRESGQARVRFWTGSSAVTSVTATSTLFAAASTGLATDYYQHVARLTGLTASTTYDYEILVSDVRLNSQRDTFTTAPVRGTGTVRFVAFGDSGTGSTQQQQVATRLAAETFDFALHGGDLAYGNTSGTGGATYQTMDSWFFTTYRSWLRGKAIFPSIGNHDSRDTNANGRPYLDLLVLPENGATSTYPDHAERYYSFDYGQAHVVVLDTELAFQDLARRNAQLAWLDADLASTTQPWKIALFHRSPYSSGGEHGSDLEVRNAFGPVFERRGVQLVISAHEHDYERTVKLTNGAPAADGVTYIVTGGGGGPLYPAATSSWTAYSASVHHYIRGTIEDCTISVEAVGVDAVVFDSVTIRRCDNQAPTVAVTAPATGATVSGVLTIQASASDDAGVTRVEFFVDGVLAGSDTSAPYSVTFNTAALADGSHAISARAYDGGGNSTTSATVTVTVDNPDAPTISSIANRTIDEDGTTGAVAFVVNDNDTAATALTVTASSSNTTLVPNAAIALGGSGNNRTVTVTPAANLSGTAVITLTVSDGARQASTQFTLTVNPVNDAPTITTIADQFVAPGGDTGALPFTIGDQETAAGALTVRATSSNTTVVPAGGIALGGSGASRNIRVTPAAGASGTATITLTVTDGALDTNTIFAVTACAYSINPASVQVSAAGGSGTFTISTSAGCTWSASTASSFITLTNASGSGTASIGYSVTANGTDTPRSGTISVGGKSFAVSQAASSLARIVVGVSGGTGDGGWMSARGGVAASFAEVNWTQLPWADYNATGKSIHLAAGDVDGDGLDELVVGTERGGGGWIAVLDDAAHGFALLKWIQVPWRDYNSANGASWPAVGDLDGDGRAEIVVGLGAGGGGFFAIFDDASASFAFKTWRQVAWPNYNSGDGSTRPAVANVDGLGAAEIIVGLGTGGAGFIEVFGSESAGFAHQSWLQVPWAAYNSANGETFVAAGDVDGDGRAEIVAGLGAGGQGWLHIFNDKNAGYASLAWRQLSWGAYNAVSTGGQVHPAVGDLDSDGRAEIVAALGPYPGDGGWFEIFDDSAAGYARLGWYNTGKPSVRSAGAEMFAAIGKFR